MGTEWGQDRALADALSGGGNALLVAPEGSRRAEEACVAATTAVEPGEALVLGVTFGPAPEERIEAWRRHVHEPPLRAACVAMGEERRGAAADAVVRCTTDAADETAVVIDAVADPADLAGLGERITRRLADWAHLDGRLALCFHSVTGMLEAVDLAPAFQFLQLLTRQVAHAGGAAHYHLDPAVVGAEARSTLRPLFDVVVSEGPADGWTVEAA